MATIKSGVTSDVMTVDATSKAARVTMYDPAGNAIVPVYSGSYCAKIEAVPATTLVDGTTYWAMRNTGAKTCYIRQIHLMACFSGTAVASVSKYRMERFAGATPTAGTSFTIVKRSTAFPASSVTDARYAAAGLTTTSVTFETAFLLFGHANQLTATASQDYDFDAGGEEGRLILATGEGLCLRAWGTITAGSNISGSVWWDER